MDFNSIIAGKLNIPERSRQRIADIASPIHFPKGHLLFQAGKRQQDLYLIGKGIARVYYHHHANEVTLCFNTEGDALMSLKSYIANEPGYENIELLEPAELYHIKAPLLKQLLVNDIHIANWARKLAERELLKTEERLMSIQFKTAAERYTDLLTKQPYLIRRVSLGHIASYLGVTQVTLSRIRAGMK